MITEVQMTTENTLHFMAVVPDKHDALFVLIISRKANLGTGCKSMAAVAPLCF